MKKGLALLSLSVLLLVSCSKGETLNLNTQLKNDYNFQPLNVELHDFEDKYQESIKSSFLVLNCISTSRGDQISSTGSGFAYIEYDKDCYYIITNRHVAPDRQHVYYVVTYTGQIIPATLVGNGGNALDIAILKAENVKDMQPAKLYCDGDVTKMELNTVGEEVYALGNPSDINLFGSIAKGVISNPKRVIRDNSREDLFEQSHAIQIDIPINPGNSGGPLFNANGEVIGVNTFKLTRDNDNEALVGMNFALPIHDMLIFADHIIKGNQTSLVGYKPYDFGNVSFLDIETMSLGDRKKYKIPDNQLFGVYVKYSQNNSLPDKTIITEINGVKIEDSFDLRRGLIKVNTNSSMLTIIDENGTKKEITVQLSK